MASEKVTIDTAYLETLLSSARQYGRNIPLELSMSE